MWKWQTHQQLQRWIWCKNICLILSITTYFQTTYQCFHVNAESAIQTSEQLARLLGQNSQFKSTRVRAAKFQIMARTLNMEAFLVQQQPNDVDCGVFAIAFVLHIISISTSPDNIRLFCQPKMRTHMLQCLKANQLTSFLLTENTGRAWSQNPF